MGSHAAPRGDAQQDDALRALVEHYRLTGDKPWFSAHTPQIKANVEWMLPQRRTVRNMIPGGERLWCQGLWLARRTPPAWLEQGRMISVKNARTHFGPTAYEIASDVDHGRIVARQSLVS